MPPNDEPDLHSDPWQTQQISNDVRDYLRSVRDRALEITTGKIDPYIVKKIREMGIEERLSKVERRQGSVANALKRGLTQILKNIEGE